MSTTNVTTPILSPGTSVLSTYRLPPRSDWERITGPLPVGMVEAPGTDPAQWNGRNSEAYHCALCQTTRVRYDFGVMHDLTASLIWLTAEQAALALASDVEKYAFLCSLGPKRTPWSPDTRMRERPMREVEWKTPLLNGDVQVIYEADDMNKPLADLYHAFGEPLPYGYHEKKWSDPRDSHQQNYYIAMWDEGVWCPMLQVQGDFDVTRFIEGFDRTEEEAGNTDPLCGLWRKENMDRRPLFQRGYSTVHVSQGMDGCTTWEWSRGHRAGQDDAWLKDGRVNTGRRYPSCMESIEKVKWLL